MSRKRARSQAPEEEEGKHGKRPKSLKQQMKDEEKRAVQAVATNDMAAFDAATRRFGTLLEQEYGDDEYDKQEREKRLVHKVHRAVMSSIDREELTPEMLLHVETWEEQVRTRHEQTPTRMEAMDEQEAKAVAAAEAGDVKAFDQAAAEFEELAEREYHRGQFPSVRKEHRMQDFRDEALKAAMTRADNLPMVRHIMESLPWVWVQEPSPELIRYAVQHQDKPLFELVQNTMQEEGPEEWARLVEPILMEPTTDPDFRTWALLQSGLEEEE